MEVEYKMAFLGRAATLADSHVVILIAGIAPSDYRDNHIEWISMRNVVSWRDHLGLSVSSGLMPAKGLL